MKHYTVCWSRPDEPDLHLQCRQLPPRVLVQRLAQAAANYDGVVVHSIVEEALANVVE